jgi:hypothetical protein
LRNDVLTDLLDGEPGQWEPEAMRKLVQVQDIGNTIGSRHR